MLIAIDLPSCVERIRSFVASIAVMVLIEWQLVVVFWLNAVVYVYWGELKSVEGLCSKWRLIACLK